MTGTLILLAAWIVTSVPASLIAARWMRTCAAANGETVGE